MHDRFVLLKRERDLNDKERLLLSGWVRNYPEEGEAHRLKEDFFTIYEAQSKDEAQGRYIGWKRGMSKESALAFSDLVRAWDKLGTVDTRLFRSSNHQRLHGKPEQSDPGDEPGGPGRQL